MSHLKATMKKVVILLFLIILRLAWKVWKKIKESFKWWLKEQDKLCPHCGYYCTGKSVFCCPPLERKE